MKKIYLLLLAISSLTACHKASNNNPNVSFSIPVQQDQAVPGIPGYGDGTTIPAGGASMPFAPVNAFVNAPQFFAQNKISAGNVVNTYLGGMNVQIITPGFHYFDFLNSIEMYMSTTSEPEVLVAYDYNIPYGIKSINLTIVPGVNLKNYITGDSVTIRLNAYANEVPVPGAMLQSTGFFNVTAN